MSPGVRAPRRGGLPARGAGGNPCRDAPGSARKLERVLSSTNLIENLFSRVRDTARRVKRWQGGTMILRWTAAGVLEAERHFRKIAGFRALPKLVAALRAHDAAIDRARQVENRKRAA